MTGYLLQALKVQVGANLAQVPPEVAGKQVEEGLRRGGKSADADVVVDDDYGNIGVGQDVEQVIIGGAEFEVAVVQLLVDGGELLISGLQLFLGGFQFFVGALQFFVGGKHFLIGGLELFGGGFVLLDQGLQLAAELAYLASETLILTGQGKIFAGFFSQGRF